MTSIPTMSNMITNYNLAHKNALEVAGVLHRDVSPSNLFFGKARNRTDHSIHMEHLPDEDRERLCTEIRNLKWRGILGDWGYAVPVVTPLATTPSDSSSKQESFVQYDNRVLARKIDSRDVPTLVHCGK